MSNLLSISDLNDLVSDITEIVQDTSINTIIKYRQFTGGNYAVTSQTYSGYTDWSGVSAIRGLVTLREVNRIGQGVEIGDTKFVFMRSSVSNTVSISDVIYDTESGTTYVVKKLGYDPLDIVNICYSRV